MTNNTHARSGSAGPGRQGVALLVAVLITGAVLFVIVGVTAGLATGTRRVNADERRAYVTLNTTESGLNTMPIRMWKGMRNKPLVFDVSSTKEQREQAFKDWLMASATGLGTYQKQSDPAYYVDYPAADGTATIKIDGIFSPSFEGLQFDLVSTGTQSVGDTKKVVSQRFWLQLVPQGGGLYSPTPLQAMTDIDASKGTGTVNGVATSGLISKTTATAFPLSTDMAHRTFDVPVASVYGVRQGDYVLINGQHYRVNSVNSTTNKLNVTLVPQSATPPASIASGLDVRLLMNASRETTTGSTETFTLQISRSTDLHVGETVFFGDKKATVEAIANGGYVTFKWVVSPYTLSVSEGDAIRRDVVAMRSAGDITVNKVNNYGITPIDGGTQVNDCTGDKFNSTCLAERDSYLNSLPNSDAFTQMLFDMTDAELNALYPLSADASKLACGPNNSGGVMHATADTVDSMFRGNAKYCGVLIVDGDINTPLNGTVEFNGFIYFRGNMYGKLNGTITINGGVAVRGGQIKGLTDDDVDTNLNGTANIIYNPALISLAMQSLNPAGETGAQSIPETWRQQ